MYSLSLHDALPICPGDSCDDSGGRGDLADSVVIVVGDEHVSRVVDRQSGRRVQLGTGCLTTVAAIATRPGSGDGADGIRRRNQFPNPTVTQVADIEVT